VPKICCFYQNFNSSLVIFGSIKTVKFGNIGMVLQLHYFNKFKSLFIGVLLFCSVSNYGQEQQLAYQYLRNGAYEKAAVLYESLYEKHPFNASYLNFLIDCYQRLERFDDAERIINKQMAQFPNQEHLYIELGYNYELQHLRNQAIPYYEKAIAAIERTPQLGYAIGKTFMDNHLLDFALRSYKKAMELNPSANYNFQIALIYGEKAEIENMFNTYLDLVAVNEKYMPSVKTYLGRFIKDDPEEQHNITLRKLLLSRMQNNPENSWTQLLSWLYLQQFEFGKALIQEKALYRRNATGLNQILDIGKMAFNSAEYTAAKDCFRFALEQATSQEIEIQAKLSLLEIDLKTVDDLNAIEEGFSALFNTYGKTVNTLGIQALYAEFLAFKKNNPDEAIASLKFSLELPVNEFQEGYLKTKLADILVFTNKFNTALIYYTQVQHKLKNHVIGQQARFKTAQTSYFKGDFEWAQTQLKVLKSSTSQLISNDALDLNLLITDNAVNDSLKIVLKKYAGADLLSYQNKDQQAIDSLQSIVDLYKGHPIEDEVLFKQAALYKKLGNLQGAEENYLKIIELDPQDILVDDAHYNLGELYLNDLLNEEKAKFHFQTIIFEYPSSIHLVSARKKFRRLRGDSIN
jgi:tetratricopeptide (TPR) repeat protein